MNVMSAVLAAAVLYLATVISTGHVGGDWAPKMLQALGAITMVESIVGICSLVLRWRWILWVHCVTISLMFVLVLTATCACLVYGTSKARPAPALGVAALSRSAPLRKPCLSFSECASRDSL